MDIAKMRRELKRHTKAKLLFLDETYVRIGTWQKHTLVAPGELPYVETDDTDAYAPRYDMIACCSGERVFPPIIFTPEERKSMKVKGIRKWMLMQYIDNVLAQAVGALDLFPLTLVMDRSNVHHTGDILQAFHDRGCQDLQTVYLMPAYSAKRLSPLDNTLFHEWKVAVRKHPRISKFNIVQIMSDEWNKIHPRSLMALYHHCGLTHSTDPYFDCPDPVAHAHPHH
jgi:hypothetical protein